jgi:hypothetical protein
MTGSWVTHLLVNEALSLLLIIKYDKKEHRKRIQGGGISTCSDKRNPVLEKILPLAVVSVFCPEFKDYAHYRGGTLIIN